jgi:excisionase family DNA binding protein
MLTKPMMTVHDAADFLQVRESTVRALINDKRLRAVKIGKEWRITENDLLAFLNENANRNPEATPVTEDDAGSGEASEEGSA